MRTNERVRTSHRRARRATQKRSAHGPYRIKTTRHGFTVGLRAVAKDIRGMQYQRNESRQCAVFENRTRYRASINGLALARCVPTSQALNLSSPHVNVLVSRLSGSENECHIHSMRALAMVPVHSAISARIVKRPDIRYVRLANTSAQQKTNDSGMGKSCGNLNKTFQCPPHHWTLLSCLRRAEKIGDVV